LFVAGACWVLDASPPSERRSDDRLHRHNAESSGLMSQSQDRTECRPPTTPAASHSLCPHTNQSTHSNHTIPFTFTQAWAL